MKNKRKLKNPITAIKSYLVYDEENEKTFDEQIENNFDETDVEEDLNEDFIEGYEEIEENENIFSSSRKSEPRINIKEKLNRKEDKIMSIHSAEQLQIILVKPESFDEASSIADHLKNKNSVLLNVEKTDNEVSRRLLDFLSGVAYCNGGQIKRSSSKTFIITPCNVDVQSVPNDDFEMDSDQAVEF